MDGLSTVQARARLAQHGPNILPQTPPPALIAVFLHQFFSPLIYILLVAALMSLMLGDIKDAVFIGVVLLSNGVIGAAQEYSAGRAAAALRRLEQPRAVAIRDGVPQEIDARDLVPGDVVALDAGGGVPADLHLFETIDLQCDESLLTGESMPVEKSACAVAGQDRTAMAFAGSMVTRGRGHGVVMQTGMTTEIGKIAAEIGRRSLTQPPLIIRMEHFARMIAFGVGVAMLVLVAAGLLRGMTFGDLFMMAVGLAVSAIPEGLPVAISVALSIGMRRMARAGVIVRRMTAVEALGSCTMIATDKTGTLTLNKLTVTHICLPDGGDAPAQAAALWRAAALANEARFDEEGTAIGDPVDVALLAGARKAGIDRAALLGRYVPVARIPYEPDLKYAAAFHRSGEKTLVLVKGAPETLTAMASHMRIGAADVAIDREKLLEQKAALAAQGLRVLAFAEGELAAGACGHADLTGLTFLGLTGMQDPVRPEVPAAIRNCRTAGVGVVMITGDDPKTAAVIAEQAGLAFSADQVASGDQVRAAEEAGPAALDRLTRHVRIFARVAPVQKLAIVMSMARNGHFVAVTGDGVNDAPALKHAHVGVAMGQKGTEVAKESADIVITDDNFASIVHGIREGRVAYANIRKVIFMLASTGAAEVALFLLAIGVGLPMPLLPVQLLWLNLVTNGIQDVALAAEKAEGDELSRPPRKPKEAIFDRIMLRRVWHATLVMGGGGFAVFYGLLLHGYAVDQARNLLLLLFVLFENFQTLNSRSERHSVFRQSLFSNPFLLLSIIGAQMLHIAAMYLPGLSDTLSVMPVGLDTWLLLLGAAAVLLGVMELEKWWDRRRSVRAD